VEGTAGSDTPKKPLLVSVEMGYGHLRAAQPLARALDVPIMHADREPLANPSEQRTWQRVRQAYEVTSRLSQLPVVGGPLRSLLEGITDIPHLHPYRDLSAPTREVKTLARLFHGGFGSTLVQRLRESGAPLLTTFYSTAVTAHLGGLSDIYCVVTDTDINRIWVPPEAAATRIHYFAPSPRVVRRLRAYGVPAERIELTGFPLPHELLGGLGLTALKRNLAARLVRLDRQGEFRRSFREELAFFLGPLPEDQEGAPPLVTFAVGGAGAQAELVERFLPGFRRPVEEGRVRLGLVAGIRAEVAERFRQDLKNAGLEAALGHGIELLHAPDLSTYFDRFNALMAQTDVLWTKPSELSFFAALGLPLLCAPPVGVHERYNRRWLIENGAALRQRNARLVAERLGDWLDEGTLAGAAWSGFMRLPKFGLYKIMERLGFTPPA